MSGDRIKILALVPPGETCQPVYFVSRAQTMIKIQSDIVNTRKGQDGDGRGIRRTQPSWGWHLVNSNFLLPHNAGGGDLAHGAQPQNRLTWCCCFCPRRRNAIFSVVVLHSLVWLACGYSVTSLQIFREREGEGKAGGVNFTELLFGAGGMGGLSPHYQAHCSCYS